MSFVYAEVYELLRNMDREKVMRIPNEILSDIDRRRNKNIVVKYDWNNIVDGEHFYPDTLNIIGYLNDAYWSNKDEDKETTEFQKELKEQLEEQWKRIHTPEIEEYVLEQIKRMIMK